MDMHNVSEYRCIVTMCFRTLLRRLRDLNLCRRSQSSPMLDIWNAVQLELRGPGSVDIKKGKGCELAIAPLT